jgi:hypothetical protein
MAGDENNSKKSFARRWLRPRLPTVQRNTLGVFDEMRALRENLDSNDLICPNDDLPLQLTTLIDNDGADKGDDQLTISTRVLACNTCGYHKPVGPIIEAARSQLTIIKKAERQFMLYGLIVSVVFAVIAYLNGNAITFFGGLLFGLALIIRYFFLIYRHWQIDKGRMYEDRPPFVDWLRYEWRN